MWWYRFNFKTKKATIGRCYRYIKKENSTIYIGALTTINTISEDNYIKNYIPLLSEVSKEFASHQIRNIATIGGNIANASPVSDLIAPLLVLDTKVILLSLAGGRSSRTTDMKQLYKVDGEYLINLQIKKLLDYGYEVAVVLGHNSQMIREKIKFDVTILVNENYDDGMFSSVKFACKELDVETLLFFHLDRPMVDKEVFEAVGSSKTKVAVAYRDSKKAPPIKISSIMKQEIQTSSFNRLDYWVESLKDVTFVDVLDEKVHFNGNTDEDLFKYFNTYAKIP